MKKSDLKDGMMVKDREGCIYLVFNGKLEALLDKFMWCDINIYENDMTCRSYSDLDIVEIRDARDTKYCMHQRFVNYNDFPVIWKREEEYNYKPGDKVQVRDEENGEWRRGYFLREPNKEKDIFSYYVSFKDNFVEGRTWEELAEDKGYGVPYRYIRQYKEEEK